MKWYKDLYVGYNLLERKRKVVRNIKRGKQQFNIFVITLAENNYDTLEIYPSHVLTQKYYMDADIVVVGIAYGREEALDMMKLMIDDCMAETGGVNVKGYILGKMNEAESRDE